MDTQKLILPLLIVAVLLGGTSLAVSLLNKPAEAPVTVAPSLVVAENAPDSVMAKPSESYLVTLDDFLTPTGAAKISGYKTTVETLASFDPEEKIECDAFVITSAPDELLNGLKKFGYIQRTTEGYPIIPLAEKGNFGQFNGTSKQKPADALALIDGTFEGGVVGCMSTPFELIWPL